MAQVSQAFIDVALAAVDGAREITLSYFRQINERQLKSDETPVTVADQECESYIHDYIARHFDDHGILGEEQQQKHADSPWQWIVDPIDGTKSFAAGNPLFGTLVALCYQGKVCLSIIDMPALDERWLGVENQKTQYIASNGAINGAINGSAHAYLPGHHEHSQKSCQTSNMHNLACSRIFATTPDMFNETTWQKFNHLSAQCQYRGFGGDCYNYGLLARGHIELICEADMKVFDYLPLCPIIEGAGGMITDWQGRALTHDSDGSVLASANADLHAQALKYLQAS